MKNEANISYLWWKMEGNRRAPVLEEHHAHLHRCATLQIAPVLDSLMVGNTLTETIDGCEYQGVWGMKIGELPVIEHCHGAIGGNIQIRYHAWEVVGNERKQPAQWFESFIPHYIAMAFRDFTQANKTSERECRNLRQAEMVLSWDASQTRY
ncbi:hypothetical protein D3C79_36910 [compost metagenome]